MYRYIKASMATDRFRDLQISNEQDWIDYRDSKLNKVKTETNNPFCNIYIDTWGSYYIEYVNGSLIQEVSFIDIGDFNNWIIEQAKVFCKSYMEDYDTYYYYEEEDDGELDPAKYHITEELIDAYNKNELYNNDTMQFIDACFKWRDSMLGGLLCACKNANRQYIERNGMTLKFDRDGNLV